MANLKVKRVIGDLTPGAKYDLIDDYQRRTGITVTAAENDTPESLWNEAASQYHQAFGHYPWPGSKLIKLTDQLTNQL